MRSWILSFGHKARVLAPSKLAARILEELEESREQYAPRMPFELPPPIYDDREPSLPFQPSRPACVSGAARRRSSPSTCVP